jgi:dipeptidyl aminopeptidase/acylaminoacyl peptidase
MLGLSGGGHMSLMTVARKPELFFAVGAFVPITDMKAWHAYNKKYAPHIEACLGGSPEIAGDEIYNARSPISYIDELSRANLKIFHGKFDPVVPFMQSVNLYNLICEKLPKSRVFLDIFDGGHEIDMKNAFYWFETQLNGTKLTAVTG